MRNDNPEERDEPEFDLDIKEEGIDPALLERIKKELQWDVINHPLTIGPFAFGAVSLAYALAVAPFLGGFLVALPMGVSALLFAVVNATLRLINIAPKYDAKADELERQQALQREAEEKQKIERSEKFLREELLVISGPQADRARKELGELTQAFHEANREIILNKNGRFGPSINDRFKGFIKDAYKDGLRVLSCVLSLLRDDPSLNRESLKATITGLNLEITKLRQEESDKARKLLRLKEKELTRLNERIKKADWRDMMIASSLDQADACEEVIRSAREDLIRLHAEDTAEALNRTMDQLDSYASILVDVHEQIKKAKNLNV